MQRSIDLMQQRVNAFGVSEAELNQAGSDQIEVGLPQVHDVQRAENEVGTTAQLYFFDWEANVLTPNGKTAASQLLAQDQNALTLSQGGATGQPSFTRAARLRRVRYQTFHSSKESMIRLDERRRAATASAIATTSSMKLSIRSTLARKAGVSWS